MGRAAVTRRRTPYAYLCPLCEHLASQHVLVSGGDLREGPYRCECGCERPQEAGDIPMSNSQYHAYIARQKP